MVRSEIRLLRSGALALTLAITGFAALRVLAQDDKKDVKQRILFVSDREKADEFAIYAMNPDGTDQTRLSKGAGIAFDPSWSPDHTSIIFARVAKKEMPQSDLYVMKADGSEPTLLVKGEEKTLYLAPSWSPDGKHISYSVIRADKPDDAAVYVADADGKNRKKIAEGLLSVWSPDGKQITFSAKPDSGGVPALKTMNADGTNVKTLKTKGLCGAWSPDGKRFAFVGDKDNQPVVFVMNADESQLSPLTKDAETMALGPTWTPDGKHLLFTRIPKDSVEKPKMQICQMDADGSNVKVLLKESAFIGFGTSFLFVMRSAQK